MAWTWAVGMWEYEIFGQRLRIRLETRKGLRKEDDRGSDDRGGEIAVVAYETSLKLVLSPFAYASK